MMEWSLANNDDDNDTSDNDYGDANGDVDDDANGDDDDYDDDANGDDDDDDDANGDDGNHCYNDEYDDSSVLGDYSLKGQFQYWEKWCHLRPHTDAPSCFKKYVKISLSRFSAPNNSFSGGEYVPPGQYSTRWWWRPANTWRCRGGEWAKRQFPCGTLKQGNIAGQHIRFHACVADGMLSNMATMLANKPDRWRVKYAPINTAHDY